MSVAIDRNVWQYLVDATQGAYDPAGDGTPLRDERVAALRVVLYGPDLWITPSIHTEFERIKTPHLLRDNAGIRDVFLREIQARDLDPVTVALRVATLLERHRDPDDCRAVAEAEMALMTHLLTFDDRLITRLSPLTGIGLAMPSAYWQNLAVPRGTAPRVAPAPTNPLSSQKWWRW